MCSLSPSAYLHPVHSTRGANLQGKMEEDPGERFRIKITVKQRGFFAADCAPSVRCFFWLLILNMVALTFDEIIVGPSPDSYSGMMSSVSVDSQLYFFYRRMWGWQITNLVTNISVQTDFCPYCYNYWRKQGFKLHTAHYGGLKHQLVYTIHLSCFAPGCDVKKIEVLDGLDRSMYTTPTRSRLTLFSSVLMVVFY